MAAAKSPGTRRRTKTRSRKPECSLCLEPFQDPRFLPCFHTFCLHCLEDLVSKLPRHRTSSFPCPHCRKTTPVPSGGVKSFQANFYLNDEDERDEDDDDRRENDDGCASKFSVCDLHQGRQLRFFCVTCNTVICRECKMASHAGHVTSDVETEAENVRSAVKDIRVNTNNNVFPKMHQAKLDVEESLNNVTESREKVRKEIKLRGEQAKLAIDNHVAESLKELKKGTSKAEKGMKTTLKEMEDTMQELSTFSEGLERMEQETDPATLLSFKQHLREFFGDQLSGSGPRRTQTATSHETTLTSRLSIPDPFSLPKFSVFKKSPKNLTVELVTKPEPEADQEHARAHGDSFLRSFSGMSPKPLIDFKKSVQQFIGKVEAVEDKSERGESAEAPSTRPSSSSHAGSTDRGGSHVGSTNRGGSHVGSTDIGLVTGSHDGSADSGRVTQAAAFDQREPAYALMPGYDVS